MAEVEQALAISIPDALQSYFLVAGRETRLNQAHNHLLAPAAWFIDSRHLVFLEENQAVVFWGVPIEPNEEDPSVAQAVNGVRIDWNLEHHSCCEFLSVMLHWQAVMGAFGRTWSAVVGADFLDALADWTLVGEVNGMHAFNRGGVALCWLRWDDEWRIFAAAADHTQVASLSSSLDVSWDPNYE